MSAQNYYARSNNAILSALGLVAATSLGCANASSVAASSPVVRYASLAEEGGAKGYGQRPIVLAFAVGDHIPVDLGLDSSVLRKNGSSRVDLEVTRPFYLLVRPDAPPRMSLDGKDFDEARKNYFRAGLAAKRGAEPHAEITIGLLPTAAPAAR